MSLELATLLSAFAKGVFATAVQEWVYFGCVSLAASMSGVGTARAFVWAVVS